MLYSPTKNGFYSNDLHGDGVPSDSIVISPEYYCELMNGQSQGGIICLNDNGHPIIVFPTENKIKVSYVSRAQGKAALIRSGLWQGVLDYVDSIPDATEKALAEVALNDTTHWQRTSPFLNAAAEALGLTQEQLDDLFVTASGIEL